MYRVRISFVVILLLVISAGVALAGDVTRTVLPNGLVLVVKQNQLSELVAIDLMIKATVFDEPADQSGVRALLQDLLLDSARGSEVEQWGAQLQGDVGLDYADFTATVISDGFTPTITALAHLLRQSSFDYAAFERSKQRRIALLIASREESFQQDYLLLRKTLYGDYPYGQSALGQAATVAALSPAQVLEFQRRWFVPNNTVIAISGNISPARARRVVEDAFGSWPNQPLPERSRPEVTPPKRSDLAVQEGLSQSAHLLIGFAAPPAGRSREFASFQVVSSLLGRGMSGRLVGLLRNDLGLAYQVTCFYPTLEQPSHFVVYVVCRLDQIDEAKQAVVKEINRLLQEPVSQDELDKTKRYLIGQYRISLQSNRQQAYYLAWYETLGLGADFDEAYLAQIDQVTPNTLRQISPNYLTKMIIALRLPR